MILNIKPDRPKWWSERAFVYKGYHGTFYEWPLDRVISLIDRHGYDFQLTTFSSTNTLMNILDQIIDDWERLNPDWPLHLHLIRQSSGRYALLSDREKRYPREEFSPECTTDAWNDELNALWSKKR
ncbi:hypothetical protein LCGC14_1010020 [marine sediment metagenome]|uniref:Uncharacterized protein n=1 Tax=marine sediment metagenome TaxID=412755 RepID=A0A0F9R6M1_9ZZZZ